MKSETIYLEPTKIRERAQMVNTILPGVIVLMEGLSNLGGDEHYRIFSPVLNIFVGGGILGAAVVELRRSRKEGKRFIGWIDVFAGVVMITTGINIHHPGRFFQPGVMYMLAGTAIIFKGILNSKISSRRQIVFDESGFQARISVFRRLRLTWSNLNSLTISESAIKFTSIEDAEHILSLRRYENRNDIMAKFKEYASGRGVKIESA